MADLLTDPFLKLVNLEVLHITLTPYGRYGDQEQEARLAELLFTRYPRLKRLEYIMRDRTREFTRRILVNGKESMTKEELGPLYIATDEFRTSVLRHIYDSLWDHTAGLEVIQGSLFLPTSSVILTHHRQ